MNSFSGSEISVTLCVSVCRCIVWPCAAARTLCPGVYASCWPNSSRVQMSTMTRTPSSILTNDFPSSPPATPVLLLRAKDLQLKKEVLTNIREKQLLLRVVAVISLFMSHILNCSLSPCSFNRIVHSWFVVRLCSLLRVCMCPILLHLHLISFALIEHSLKSVLELFITYLSWFPSYTH